LPCQGSSDDEYHQAQSSSPSSSLPPQPFNTNSTSILEIPHDNEASLISEGESWIIGEHCDPDQEQQLQTSEADPQGELEVSGLDHIPCSQISDSPICSRVLGDIYHLMAMFKISPQHGLHRPFARALHDAIFLPDPHDKAAMSQILQTRMITFDQMVLRHPTWVWRRVKRFVPPPEVLLPHVKLILQTYGPLLDATTHQPLFNKLSWEKAKNILENIRMGYYSDPPGIVLYISMGKDSDDLNLYKCLRGTNHVEGGVHQNIAKRFGSYNTSPRFALNLLWDYCLCHNLKVRFVFQIIFSSYNLIDRWELTTVQASIIKDPMIYGHATSWQHCWT
jgi:hypothetical protein